MGALKRVGSVNTYWRILSKMRLVREDGIVYLDRLRIIQTPWFGMFLHRMDGPDPGEDLHDHPWPFISIILKGGYVEEFCDIREASERAFNASVDVQGATRGDLRIWKRWSVHRIPLTTCHRITRLVEPTPTWTLVIVGRRSQPWGFYTPDGFVMDETYDFSRRDNMREEK